MLTPYDPRAWDHAARPTGPGTPGAGAGASGSPTSGLAMASGAMSAGGGYSEGGAMGSTNEADAIGGAAPGGGGLMSGMLGNSGGFSGSTGGSSAGAAGAPANLRGERQTRQAARSEARLDRHAVERPLRAVAAGIGLVEYGSERNQRRLRNCPGTRPRPKQPVPRWPVPDRRISRRLAPAMPRSRSSGACSTSRAPTRIRPGRGSTRKSFNWYCARHPELELWRVNRWRGRAGSCQAAQRLPSADRRAKRPVFSHRCSPARVEALPAVRHSSALTSARVRLWSTALSAEARQTSPTRPRKSPARSASTSNKRASFRNSQQE